MGIDFDPEDVVDREDSEDEQVEGKEDEARTHYVDVGCAQVTVNSGLSNVC